MSHINTLPLEKIEGYIWLDGNFIEWKEAKIHTLTHSLHYSGGVFEGIKAVNGNIFEAKAHTKRFFYSAKLMKLELDFTEEFFIQAMYETLKANNLENAYIRPFAWRSTEILTVKPLKQKTHCIIAAWKPRAPSKSDPLKLTVSKWKKPTEEIYPSQCKTSSQYSILTLAIMDAISENYDDAIMLDINNYIAECTTSNIFFIDRNNNLITPKTKYCLNGITRQTTINIAKKLNVNVIEKDIHLDELINYQSSFITGTASGLKLVGSINYSSNNIDFNKTDLFISLKDKYEQLLQGKNNE